MWKYLHRSQQWNFTESLDMITRMEKKELDEEHHYRLEKDCESRKKYEYNKVDHKNDIG